MEGSIHPSIQHSSTCSEPATLPGAGTLQDRPQGEKRQVTHKRIPGTNRRCKGKKCVGEEGFTEEEIPELRLEREKEVPWDEQEGVLKVAAAAAESLQLCLTLCDPIDGSPPGSAVPGILQARTLEWVAISFSSEGKWKVKVKSLSCVRLFVTPWTAAHQAPTSMGFSRQEDWSGVPSPSPLEGWGNSNSLGVGTSVACGRDGQNLLGTGAWS